MIVFHALGTKLEGITILKAWVTLPKKQAFLWRSHRKMVIHVHVFFWSFDLSVFLSLVWPASSSLVFRSNKLGQNVQHEIDDLSSAEGVGGVHCVLHRSMQGSNTSSSIDRPARFSEQGVWSAHHHFISETM